MGGTADELAERMTARELVEHMADYSIEPWGEGRMDWRFGVLCAVVRNMLLGKGQKPYGPADFVPNWSGDEKAGKTDEEIQAAAMLVLGGGD